MTPGHRFQYPIMSTDDCTLEQFVACVLSVAHAMRVGFDGMANKQLVTLFELLEPQPEAGSVRKRLKLKKDMTILVLPNAWNMS